MTTETWLTGLALYIGAFLRGRMFGLKRWPKKGARETATARKTGVHFLRNVKTHRIEQKYDQQLEARFVLSSI